MRFPVKWAALWLLLNLTSFEGKAQNIIPNSNSLYALNMLFDRGQLVECLTLCDSLLKSTLNREERAEVYRIQSIAYFISGETMLARKSAIKLLKIKPDYLNFPLADTRAYRLFLNNLKPLPDWLIGLQGGSVMAIPSYSAYYSSYPFNTSIALIPSYSVGAKLEKHIWKGGH